MTTSNPSIAFDMTSDATFQAWTQAIHNALLAVGLVQTTDTGQVSFATASRAAGAQYAVYRFSDSLQSTAPVYLRVGYGTGSTTNAQIVLSLGTGTNGAGTLTGSYTTTASSRGSAGGSATPVPCYFSSDGSYLTMALGLGGGGLSTNLLTFVADRTRNADGSPNSDGLYAVSAPVSSGAGQCTALRFSGTPQIGRNWVSGTNAAFPCDAGVLATPAGGSPASGVAGTDLMLFPHLPYCGELEYPALAALGIFGADATVGTTFSATVGGAAHTYLATGSWTIGMGFAIGNSSVTVHSIALRYE